jgi:hypothetical protein
LAHSVLFSAFPATSMHGSSLDGSSQGICCYSCSTLAYDAIRRNYGTF